MNPLDFTKPITTRDGTEFILLSKEGPNKLRPIVGYIKGETETRTYPAEGQFWLNETCSKDLINPPIKRWVEFWVNTFENGDFMVWNTRYQADRLLGEKRIACLHFTREYEENEGL